MFDMIVNMVLVLVMTLYMVLVLAVRMDLLHVTFITANMVVTRLMSVEMVRCFLCLLM